MTDCCGRSFETRLKHKKSDTPARTKLGAKNWLYIGHPDAGWRSAVIYSITGRCKLLKANPVDYLSWVLPRLAAATSGQINGLLPHDSVATLAAA